MKRTLSVCLSLIMALSLCLSMAFSSFSAERKYELPKTIKGHSKYTDDLNDEINSTVDDWNVSLSYDKSSKTLNCTCAGSGSSSGLLEYLYSLSTDNMSNRFLDQNNTAIMFAEEEDLNLFSVDPIRFGKIKEISIKEKSGKTISPVEKWTFETKNNKVVGNAIYVLNTRGQLWARVKNSFSYDKNGLISKIVMTCRDPDLHYKVECSYSYDAQNRPTSCLWKQIDTETGKVTVTNRIDYSDFNNVGWPTSTKITELDDPHDTYDGEKQVFEFNNKGQMAKDYGWNYTYDSQGRLSQLSSPASNPKFPDDGEIVTYSSYFEI